MPEPTKPPTTRRKGLGDTTLLHLRLTTPQADWLRSTAKREAISIASVVRGMIEAERRLDDCEAESAKLVKSKALTEVEVVRGDFRGWAALAQPGFDTHTMEGRNAIQWVGDKWALYRGDVSVYPMGNGTITEAQAIAWCLKGVLP